MNQSEITSVQLVFKVKTITAERQIPVEELGLSENSLPAEVKSFLKEYVIPTEQLRGVNRIRRKTELDLDRIAVKDEFDKNWYMSPEDSDQACYIVMEAEKQVEDEKARLKTRYPLLCQEVLDRIDEQFGEYELVGTMQADDFIARLKAAVKKHQPKWEYIEQQIGVFFQFRPCAEMSSKDPKVFKVFQDNYAQQNLSLFGTLLGQVVKRSQDILKIVYNGEQLQRSTISTVETMQKKVNRLSFLDKRLKPLAAGMLTVLKEMPPGKCNVPINQLGKFIAMITLLSDEKRLMERLDNNEPLIFKSDDKASVVQISQKKSTKASTASVGSKKIAPRKLQGTTNKSTGFKRTGVQLKLGS